MIIFSAIKRLTSRFHGKRKKRENGYLRDNYAASNVPRENKMLHKSSKKLEAVKRMFAGKPKAQRHVYSTRASRTRKSFLLKASFCLAGAGVALILLFAGRVIIHGRLQDIAFFHVDDIELTGNRFVTKELVREVAGIIPHQTSMFELDEQLIEARLSKLDWIASVSVEKDWPSTLEIKIRENEPVALLHSENSVDGQLRYIDRKGVPFMTVTAGADVDYPVITGLAGIADSLARSKALAEVLDFLARVRRANSAYLPAQLISEVHVDEKEGLVVYLVEYPFPIFFGNGNTKRKVLNLEYVLKELYGKRSQNDLISQVEYIQMDYQEGKVLVKKSGSG